MGVGGGGKVAAVPFPAVHNIHVSWNILFSSLACISFPFDIAILPFTWLLFGEHDCADIFGK